MGYQLRTDESVEKATKRVLRKELEKAGECLSGPQPPKAEDFHQVRKSLKKARAVLRLARTVIGEDCYSQENAEYRDIARVFAPVRDAEVRVATFEGLMETYRDQVSLAGFAKAQNQLRRQNRAAALRMSQDKGASKQAAFQLKRAATRVDRLAFHGDGWEAIEGGLRRVYRKARRSFRAAYGSPNDIAFHEARKVAKYLRHQIDLIEPCWGGPLRELSRQLHELSDLLGLDHDLVMLRESVARDPKLYGSTASVQALFALIERRQQELRERAEPLGRRLYVEKATAFLARLQVYWDLWHRPRPSPSAVPPLLVSAYS